MHELDHKVVSAFIAAAIAQGTPKAGFRKLDSLDSAKKSSAPRA
ncbi:MAG: hypothetical protein V4747_20075 [Pseudomonadota bacterium]